MGRIFLGLLITIACYLLGGFNPAYYLGKRHGIDDIRKLGSGNPGTTNVLRTMGKSAAVITLAFDILKGVVCALLGLYLLKSAVWGVLCGLAVVIGHNYPLQLKFKGGKGVATSLGVIVVICPIPGILAVITGVVIIAVTRFVSLGAIVGFLSFIVYTCILSGSPLYITFAVILAILAIYRHSSNIKRLIRGKESKIKF